MSESEVLLEYNGQVDQKVIESLLKKLRKSEEFNSLNKITYKRVYAIVVECLENICKNPLTIVFPDRRMQPGISVTIKNDKIHIIAGNPIPDSVKESLAGKIDHVNNLNEKDLRILYEHKLNRDSLRGENGAGLGFIYMLLKSENKLNYSISPLQNGYSYFEIKIILNKNIMRKLIIEKTSSSPKVVLDPEKRIYLISGESRPPDVREFYGQILTWLQEFSSYLTNPDYNKEPVVFNFNFEYFNSSSGKLILDICKVLAGLRLKGINLTVKWYYEKEDGDMLEVGKEMSGIVKFPFEYVESEPD
jgi:hypothetical protein